MTISLHFAHPTIDPAEITDTLGVSPTLTRRIGDPLVGLDGKVRPNVERQTRWVLRQKYYDREAASEEVNVHINDRLAELLEPLVRQRSFVKRVATGGRASIDIGVPGQHYLAFVIDAGSSAGYGILDLTSAWRSSQLRDLTAGTTVPSEQYSRFTQRRLSRFIRCCRRE